MESTLDPLESIEVSDRFPSEFNFVNRAFPLERFSNFAGPSRSKTKVSVIDQLIFTNSVE
jgi:hypothetical protein